jgi:hypothetical protein
MIEITVSGGEQRIARSCLPMIESQEESYEGCMDIKTSGVSI